MSGHSKWANIKRRKAAVDAQKGRLFSRVAREILVAVRHGGPNPDANPRLKAAMEKARQVNMPMENVQRAIARGSGEGEGSQLEELVYEGYGPGGVAILLDILTDNRNRTAQEIRHLFAKHGGSLGEAGCVAWMFDTKGVVQVPAGARSEDELLLLALDAGAEDLAVEDGVAEITCAPGDLERVRAALEGAGVPVEAAEVRRVARTRVPVSGQDAERLIRLIDALEEHDDVQAVASNFEMEDEELDRLTGS